MQSKLKSVNAYLKEVPQKRVVVLKKLRELCLKELKGFEESMTYGMPSYSRNGEVEVAFASQKNYISLYILKQDVMNVYIETLAQKGVSFGKGCIRYSRPEHINLEVVKEILITNMESGAPIC